MAQLVVRNIEDSLKTRLQRRARKHGRSMEEEVREILRDALCRGGPPAAGLGTEIVRLFAGTGADFRELRGHRIEPVSFEP